MVAELCLKSPDTIVQSRFSLASGVIANMNARTLWFTVALMTAISAAAAGEELRSLGKATTWLNSQPLSSTDLRGKVVLVDFWTYTCINWRRTVPWLRAWAKRYEKQGLVIVGVHTPEFSFEKDLDYIRRAVADQDIDYPVAVDSSYSIWNAFDNNYWPAVYLVDAQGRVRHQQFGEGDYESLERVIQRLLAEAGHRANDSSPASIEAHGAEVAADWDSLKSPETYFGSARGGERRAAAGKALAPNQWALSGDWAVKRESAVLNAGRGAITYRFHARDVHLVMGPAVRGTPVKFRVLIDGQPAGASHGVDVDENGYGTIDYPRMYHLIRQSGPIMDRTFEIEFSTPGAEVFAFTFG
jgi:thiol-disulfide isomerase/thioredoxin